MFRKLRAGAEDPPHADAGVRGACEGHSGGWVLCAFSKRHLVYGGLTPAPDEQLPFDALLPSPQAEALLLVS